MEVIYYQAFIFLTIVFSRFIFPKHLIWVCIFWTVFTLANLFYPPLILIQLIVVWGSYTWLRVEKTKTTEIDKLKRERNQKDTDIENLKLSIAEEKARRLELQNTIDSLDPGQKEKLKKINLDQTSLISGRSHYDEMINQISNAKKSIFIISGWIGDNVINNKFLHLLETRIAHGVKVYFCYGYQDYKGVHNQTESSKRALIALQNVAARFPNMLTVKEAATHEKILIVDEEIAIFTSANWLNNKNYANAERGVIIRNEKLASQESQRIREEYFS